MDHSNLRRTIIIAFIILLIALRFLLLDFANFAPIAAAGIFAVYYFSNKKLAFIIPLVVLFLSDLLLQLNTGKGLYLERSVDYLGLITGIGIAYLIFQKSRSFGSVLGVTILSSLAFFFISNFGVWATGAMYEKSFTGLLTCFEMGIPFYRSTLIGDVVFTFLFIALFEIVQILIPQLQLQTK